MNSNHGDFVIDDQRLSMVDMANNRMEARRLETRIIRDLLLSALLTILFSALCFFFSLQDAIAEWFGMPEIRDMEKSVPVLLYSVWVIGIFTLRRVYDLRCVLRNSARIEQRLYAVKTAETVAGVIAGVSHDFNNLMQVVRGSIDLASQDKSCSVLIRPQLASAIKAINGALRLSEQLYRLGKMADEPRTSLDMNVVVTDMLDILKHFADKVGAVIEVDLEKDACRVFVSQGQVEQVLLNLVVNACEAAHRSDKVIIATSHVEVLEYSSGGVKDIRPGRYIELSVKDSGCGMNPELIDKIFQADFTTKEFGKGIGLATVKQIIKTNSGCLQVRSMPGEGTVFRTFWPALVDNQISL